VNPALDKILIFSIKTWTAPASALRDGSTGPTHPLAPPQRHRLPKPTRPKHCL